MLRAGHSPWTLSPFVPRSLAPILAIFRKPRSARLVASPSISMVDSLAPRIPLRWPPVSMDKHCLPAPTLAASTARRIEGFLPAPGGTGHTAGLYSFGVQYTTSPGPFTAPSPAIAFTNVAVIPDYGG